jgi:hypothetical protein
MNRVDRREPIVRDDADRERFVETLVPEGWIAERLKMRSVANVNIYHVERTGVTGLFTPRHPRGLPSHPGQNCQLWGLTPLGVSGRRSGG